MSDINKNFSEFMLRIGQQASSMIRDDYGKMPHILSKSAFEFKTKTDDRVDDFLRNEIALKFPTHGMVTEEAAPINENSEFVWVIDPLDGTLNFTLGVTDLFAVSIALFRNRQLLMGMIAVPMRNDIYFAIKDQGAYKNKSKINKCSCPAMSDAVVALEYGKKNRDAILPFQKKLLSDNGVHYTYTFCNATVPMAMVAEGKISAYMGLSLDIWDVAAGVIINREVGNRVSNTKGQDWSWGDSEILVSEPKFHDQLMYIYTKT